MVEVHAAVHDAAVHDDQLLAAAAAEPAGGDADVSGPGPTSSWRRYYKYHQQNNVSSLHWSFEIEPARLHFLLKR